MNSSRSLKPLAATFALAANLIFLPSLASAQSITGGGVVVQTIIDQGIEGPTGMAFLDFNEFLVIEKSSGRVKHVREGEVVGVAIELPVSYESEQGLLGITLHPNFAANRFIYLYYSLEEGGSWVENRVSRFTWTGSALIDETPIISFPYDPAQNNGPSHDAGIIKFGPDGKLYGVTGDLTRGRFEQNDELDSFAGVGGVFRLNDDGTIPADNPFSAHPNPAVQRLFAYGIRNSFGLTFDPLTGHLWDTENGPSNYDEVNLVVPGFNSGWLDIMGPDSRDAQNVSDLAMIPGASYQDPKLSFEGCIGITAIAFIDTPLLPASWQGTAVFGDALNGNFYRLQLNAARDAFVFSGGLADLVADSATERNALRIGTGWGVTTDLEIGPDGSLYQVSMNGQAVRRIGPTRVVGDMNCDGAVTTADIPGFAIALCDPNALLEAQTPCDVWRADLNNDIRINADDIEPFIALLLD